MPSYATKALARLRRFAEDDQATAPLALLGGRTRREWAALTVDERLDHLRAHVEAETPTPSSRARRATPAPSSDGKGELAPPNDTHASERVATSSSSSSSWSVACACQCGAWLPARGPQPVVAYAPSHRPRRKRPAPTRTIAELL